MKRKKIASICLGALLIVGLGACDNFSFGSTGRNNVPPTFEADEDDDDGGEEDQIDKRVALTSGSVYFDGSDVPFANEADLTSSASADVGGNVTYTLSGTASSMSTSQANEFYPGVAAAGDTYIVATVILKEDETLVWYSADNPSIRNTLTYEQCNGSEDFIIRISGVTPDGTPLAGDPFTFTITNGEGEVVSHTLDFSNVSKIPARVALGTVTLGNSTFINDASLSIASKVMDTSGNITYTLSGKAGEMSTEQANAYWPEVAEEGDLFIVITVSLKEGESVSANSSSSISYDDCGGEENYIVRLTGTSTSGATSITFTISDGTTSVNHVIDFSALLPADNGNGDGEGEE